MPYFAIINNNSVTNIAIADYALNIDGLWLDITSADIKPEIGWKYENSEFIKPAAVLEPLIVYNISKVAMITRFTDEEFVAILTAVKNDVQIEAWYARFNAAQQIDLQDPRTIAGINVLVSKGLLTQQRADAILTTPIAPLERA